MNASIETGTILSNFRALTLNSISNFMSNSECYFHCTDEASDIQSG